MLFRQVPFCEKEFLTLQSSSCENLHIITVLQLSELHACSVGDIHLGDYYNHYIKLVDGSFAFHIKCLLLFVGDISEEYTTEWNIKKSTCF